MHDETSEASSRSTEAATENTAECLVYPVESPLTASFDSETGILTLESTIHRDAGERSLIRLRLNFSPDAAHGFVRLLKAVENELGTTLADRGRRFLQH